MKHHITIEIPEAPDARTAVNALKQIARAGNIEEFIVRLDARPDAAPPPPLHFKPNPMLRPKPKSESPS